MSWILSDEIGQLQVKNLLVYPEDACLLEVRITAVIGCFVFQICHPVNVKSSADWS